MSRNKRSTPKEMKEYNKRATGTTVRKTVDKGEEEAIDVKTEKTGMKSESKIADGITQKKESNQAVVIAIITAIIGGCCLVIAALISLGTPIVADFLETKKQVAAEATPTFIPPTEAIILPVNQSEIITAVLNPFPSSSASGIINLDLDPNATTVLSVANEDITFVHDISPQIHFSNRPDLIFEILLTGEASDEEVQVTNRIPISVTYEPIPDIVNLYQNGFPGGINFFPVLSANIPPENKQVWAQYSSDMKEKYQETDSRCPGCVDISNFPSEIKRYLNSEEQGSPDFFLLKKNEKVAIPVVLLLQKPGIYKIQIGVEYIYRQYKNIIWIGDPMEVFVPKNYNTWFCTSGDSNDNLCKIYNSCKAAADGISRDECIDLYQP